MARGDNSEVVKKGTAYRSEGGREWCVCDVITNPNLNFLHNPLYFPNVRGVFWRDIKKLEQSYSNHFESFGLKKI